jgi:hypothetical protein
MAHYQKPDWFNLRILNPTVQFATRLGISVWGSRILRVKGRMSGQWHSHPGNLLTYEGMRYLVAPRGLTQWVRNIRVSGGGELLLGNHTEPFRAVEVSDDDKIPILRAYLKRWKFEVGQFFGGVDGDSPEPELRRIAPEHPVFRVEKA